MKLRHAAALALVGWYLMVSPPDSNNPVQIFTFQDKNGQLSVDEVFAPNLNAPLSEWHHGSIFASRNDCEATRQRLRSTIERHRQKSTTRSEDAFDTTLTSAGCVRTDDPRLKEK